MLFRCHKEVSSPVLFLLSLFKKKTNLIDAIMGSAVSSPDATPIDLAQAKDFAGELWNEDLESKFIKAAGEGDTVNLGVLKLLTPELFKSKNLLIIGAGPGISGAVARKFGGQGYKVALVSLIIEDAEQEENALKKAGIAAFSFACDAKVQYVKSLYEFEFEFVVLPILTILFIRWLCYCIVDI